MVACIPTFALLASTVVLAAPPPSPSPVPYGFRQIGKDIRFLVTRPAHLDETDELHLFQTGFATAGLYLLRDDVREYAQEHQSPGTEQLLKNVRTMGKGAFAPSLALVFWLSSYGTGNPREKETSVLLLESVVFSYLGSAIGSFVIASERPEDGTSVRFFRTDGHGVSTDAAIAASVVQPLRRQYLRLEPDDGGWMRAWKVTASGLLYGGAALTAYQRIYDDKHWAPDAFLGVMTGLTVGDILCESHGLVPERRVRVGASAVPGGVGLTFTIDLDRGGQSRLRP